MILLPSESGNFLEAIKDSTILLSIVMSLKALLVLMLKLRSVKCFFPGSFVVEPELVEVVVVEFWALLLHAKKRLDTSAIKLKVFFILRLFTKGMPTVS